MPVKYSRKSGLGVLGKMLYLNSSSCVLDFMHQHSRFNMLL